MGGTLFLPQVFDPKAEWSVVERKFPHCSQPGAITFITFRTFDSLPEQVVRSWHADRKIWLKRHGIEGPNWQAMLSRLPIEVQEEYDLHFSNRWETELDQCQGACDLERSEIAKIVADSLLHFNEDRYLLTDFVVMPNHVHILAAFRDEESLLKQCESWKHFTATAINRVQGRQGRFWQQDGFDHLVRSEGQFRALQTYIAENPKWANVSVPEVAFFHRSLS